jgi:hypothetical protein
MRSTHTRWAMFSPLLADQVIDISDMPQSTGSNKHICRMQVLSCILLSWLKIYLIDISLSILLVMFKTRICLWTHYNGTKSGETGNDDNK